MTDTPIAPPSFPPPARIDQIKGLIGDLARPFAIYSTAAAVAFAITDKATGTDKLTAAGLILGALFAAKTVENQQAGKQAASVAIAQATSPSITPNAGP